jgi:hypothetical protein
LFDCRVREAEQLREELRQAKLEERLAKEKLLEITRGSMAYPVITFLYSHKSICILLYEEAYS